MNISINSQLKDAENSRWNSFQSTINALENKLLNIHPRDFYFKKVNKELFWLLDAIIRYNHRRTKLFNNITHTDMSNEEWIKFDNYLKEIENTITRYITQDLDLSREIDSKDMKDIKEQFWLMDGFVKTKLKICISYATKNGIDSSINELDIESNSENNPMFNLPKDFKINRQSLAKVIGNKIAKKISKETMDDIKRNSYSNEEILSIVEEVIYEDLKNSFDDNNKNNTTKTATLVQNIQEILENTPNEQLTVEIKSCNPFNIGNNNNNNNNPFLYRNKLKINNPFTTKNLLFKEKTKEEIKEEKQLEREKDIKMIEEMIYERELQSLIEAYMKRYGDPRETKSYEERVKIQRNLEELAMEITKEEIKIYLEVEKGGKKRGRWGWYG